MEGGERSSSRTRKWEHKPSVIGFCAQESVQFAWRERARVWQRDGAIRREKCNPLNPGESAAAIKRSRALALSPERLSCARQWHYANNAAGCIHTHTHQAEMFCSFSLIFSESSMSESANCRSTMDGEFLMSSSSSSSSGCCCSVLMNSRSPLRLTLPTLPRRDTKGLELMPSLERPRNTCHKCKNVIRKAKFRLVQWQLTLCLSYLWKLHELQHPPLLIGLIIKRGSI